MKAILPDIDVLKNYGIPKKYANEVVSIRFLHDGVVGFKGDNGILWYIPKNFLERRSKLEIKMEEVLENGD